MAAVLDALASYLKDMLMEMAKEEVSMLLGVSGEIDKLGGKLHELQDVLADAERRRITDKHVERWVGMLKDVMYEATDILDLCKLKEEERQSNMGVDFRCCNPIMLFCMWGPAFAHDIGSRIKDLNRKLDVICESSNMFSFIRTADNQGPRVARPHAGSKTSPVMERLSLVGAKIEEDTGALVDMLTKEVGTGGADNNMMVVAIAGIGGIGKTTLARNIYNHQTITDKFSKKIWLSVTQNFTETELLSAAINHAEGHHYHAHDKSLLEPTLVNTIRDKKIFVVLDDMWSAAEWNNMLKASFSYAARGSCVLVTTRDDRVAREMRAQYLHRIDFLGRNDAWSLLKKQVIATERDRLEIDTLEDIGFDIIGRCGGLPLAIKVIGGLLRQRDMNKVEWERVLNNPAWSIVGIPEELNHAIYLSYDDLPPHLKQCLLFYSLFPEGKLISRDPLVQMWISEGLVSSSSSDNLEEIGEKYYEELIMRNLIEPDKGSFDKSHCIIHDVVRSFCQCMARDEALVAQKGEIDIASRLGSQKFRVLSITVESGGELEWSVLQEHNSMRRLISYGPIKFKPGDTLSRLSSLRTIDICDADFGPLVDYLSELKHLRYLSIECPEISSLPDNIGKMKFLQHISLFNCDKMVRLPSGIVKLKQLRYLNLGGTNINTIPRGFAALTNLRILIDFPAHMDGDSNDWCSLEELGPLSQLRNLELKGLENVFPSSLATKASLRTKTGLVNLSLACNSKNDVPEEEQRRIEDLFDELCPPASINSLGIHKYFGRRLPNWTLLRTAEMPLERLKFLLLQDLGFCTQLPDGLCQLPYLETFVVRRAPAIKSIGPELLCYNHPSWASKAFPRLDKLVMEGMVRWEEWEWEEQVEAMAVLKELELNTCKVLRHLPPGLAIHARALKMLTLRDAHCLLSLENFPYLVELDVSCCHSLKGITNLPSLHNLSISCCPELEVLDGVPKLGRLYLDVLDGVPKLGRLYLEVLDGVPKLGRLCLSHEMSRLPTYLLDLNVAHLVLCCNLPLLCCMALGNATPEWDKFRNIRRVEAHDHNMKFRVSYTRDPRYLQTNISHLFFDIKRCRDRKCRRIHL